ncbi:MAG: division/cell wall cluster transcriptional repressor MraZ, partial [Clostridiales bacterium]|nr:division/cell wall cluster transcriptional repressor MraZ [Clostridiales bacterium]
ECLKIYPMPEWDKLMAKIGEQSFTTQQKLRRFFCEKAQKFVLDKQGRFCIPQELRDYAGLEETAIIVGMESTIEVWNEARWNAINSDITSENSVSLMEEIGF